MTVTTLTSRISYDGDGAILVFAYPFTILEDEDLVVLVVDAAGVETTQLLTTDYTVSNAGVDGGGNVTMVVEPTGTERLVIYRDIEQTQETDYVNNDPFGAETHEDALDKLTMLIQQNSRDISRTIILSPGSDLDQIILPAPDAGKALIWDPTAMFLINSTYNPDDIVDVDADVAAVIILIDEFYTVYLGSFATPPTTDNEGNTLIVGATYFNTGDDILYIWNGTTWVAAAVPATFSYVEFFYDTTIVGGETAVPVTDDNALTLAYTPGAVDLFRNGVKIIPTDFTATTGTTITGLPTALAADDVIEVRAYTAFSVVDHYTKAESDGLYELSSGGAGHAVITNQLADAGFVPATMRTNLGLAIGTNVQAWDADLDTIAAFAKTANNFMMANGAAWTLATPAQVRTGLALGALALLNTVSNAEWAGTDLSVLNGGTGASDAATARTNLGLGALAVLATINDSNWSGTDLAIVNGGTGASDATTARANLGVSSGGADSVSQTEIESAAAASQSANVSAAGTATIALTGGTWSFDVFNAENLAEVDGLIERVPHTVTSTATYKFRNTDTTNAGNAYCYSRYVAASPPYDLGDGEIPLFIQVAMLHGKIAGVCIAKDPPWIYNGSHANALMPDRRELGHGTRKYAKLLLSGNEVMADRPDGDVREWLEKRKAAQVVEVEITPQLKNMDMHEMPHCWPDLDRRATVLFLDPFSDAVADVALALDAGHDPINMIYDGDIKFGNEEIGRKRPPGQMSVTASWR